MEQNYWQEEEYPVDLHNTTGSLECGLKCTLKDGYFYCTNTLDRCANGYFDKPWSKLGRFDKQIETRELVIIPGRRK